MSIHPTRAVPGAVIVDSGLRSYGGHNYFYTREVQNAFKRLGIPVRVLVNRGFPAEQAEADGFTPAFSIGAHDHPLGRGFFPDLAYVYAQSVVFSHELDAALGQDSQELVFSHTVGDFELIGWRRSLRRCGFLGRLVLLMRVIHGARGASRFRQFLHPYLIRPRTLRAIGKQLGDRFALATDSDPLSVAYSAIFSGRIVTLPIPVATDMAEVRPDEQVSPAGLRVGYIGDARESKGFHLLSGAIRGLLPQTKPSVSFVIQMSWPSQGRGAADVPQGVVELEALAAGHPGRFRLIRHRLGPEEYRRLINGVDIVLLPYSTELYRESTSGIFAEALHLGKVVVVSDATWMAHELQRSGGGAAHRRNDVDDLIAQTLGVIDGYDGYRRRAEAFRVEWSAFHNPDELVRTLIRATGPESSRFPNLHQPVRVAP